MGLGRAARLDNLPAAQRPAAIAAFINDPEVIEPPISVNQRFFEAKAAEDNTQKKHLK